ncbi:UdgX family uracil-DNA binding protein [Paraburkholderia sp. MMS20-SJTR3]|uniref:Type-4 uracil-DNA glycosylase n=1 Tax=Paraburkholderia sejongensis TaxID=2886946 RepID=A0ABS8K2C9_9BURK|nr:UdgX family uracil-DNA binding protein [Paraburkholderia sp. MMS20-SJTR3]MCC8396150.1 UdgX family uracil-DNA binding protein [Paraburkholderia sp. MMS20-SJTR3]
MTDGQPKKRTRDGARAQQPEQADVDPAQQPAKLDDCRRCALWRNATQAVPGEGQRHAAIVLVGEQPGDMEDLQGKPFVGPAGALLDKALAEAGLKRHDVYVTNAVKHFKWIARGKRRLHKTPAQREVDACSYWLEQELAKPDVQVVVALGATALKAVLDDSHARLQDAFDKTIERGNQRVVATYHPSFALRAPDPDTRRNVYEKIVAALQTAQKLALERKAR